MKSTPEANRERARRWAAKNPERMQVIAERKRARKRAVAISDLTVEQWRGILAYFNFSCAYCLAEGVPLTQDHIQPLSRGGNHTASNVVPACQSCNSQKNALSLARFLLNQTKRGVT